MFVDTHKAHNEDGPAFTIFNMVNYWYLNGTMLSFDDWISQLREIRGDNHAALMRLKWENK